jgi:hypothetical protein
MSKQIPAFPFQYEDGGGGYIQHPGMTMRQWYKGMALNGMLNHITESDNGEWPYNDDAQTPFESVAKAAGQFADAMLAEDAAHEKDGGE